jgi:hypothetical protein
MGMLRPWEEEDRPGDGRVSWGRKRGAEVGRKRGEEGEAGNNWVAESVIC